jgi:hypothetical protein
MKTKVFMVSVITIIVFAGSMVFAQNMACKKMDQDKSWSCLSDKLKEFAAKELDQSLQTKINEMLVKAEKERVMLHAQLKVKMIDLKAAITNEDPIVRKNVDKLVLEINELRGQVFSSGIKTGLDVLDLLNPEQKKKAIKVLDNFEHCCMNTDECMMKPNSQEKCHEKGKMDKGGCPMLKGQPTKSESTSKSE